jgi:adenylate cyclase
VVLRDGNGEALRVVRGVLNKELQVDHFKIAEDSQFAALANQIRTRKQPYWGLPVPTHAPAKKKMAPSPVPGGPPSFT